MIFYFESNFIECSSIECIKVNEIVNNFLLTGDKFMPEMHLEQPASLDKPGFTYSACGPFTKTKKEYRNLKKQDI